MDLLRDRVKPLYFRYLRAAFGSALISSIYGVVDMAMVGQYQGPQGTAGMAVVSPVWNIIYSLGLLMGIGGSVLLSTLRGQGEERRANEVFTCAVIGTAVLAALSWVGLIFFDRELLLLFGAEETLLPLARRYVLPVKAFVPLFLLSQMLSAFLRNDGNPALATRAVLAGGIFNVFGDYAFVFVLDMGIFGAGLATGLGCTLTVLVMLTHFASGRCNLRLVRPAQPLRQLARIAGTGFSTFFVDVAMGILTVIFNRQILRWLNADALSVYGIIINISTFVQCCAYSIGQASQPILSVNYGAGQHGRIRQTLRCALGTAAAFGLIWTAVSLGAPNLFVRIFMQPTQEILAIAPAIIRRYGLSFLLLPVNIFSTYYFQAMLLPGTAFAVSVGRGALVSGALLLLLPACFGADAIWFAMPVTEAIVFAYAAVMMRRCSRRLSD